MAQQILVPLDGTPAAAVAVPYAAAFARATGASVLLLHTVPAPAASRARYANTTAEPASDMLEAQAVTLRQQGITVDTLVLTGETMRWIIDVARVRGIALIVMARRSHGLFGTITEAVLARTSVPVLLVSGDTMPDGPERLRAAPRLLVPLDGSATAEEALAVASKLAGNLGGGLVLLHATVPAGESVAGDALPDVVSLYTGYLRDLVVRGAVVAATVRCDVRPGEPTAAILASCHEHGAALIVMTTHCQGGPYRYTIGRVARALVHRSHLPVLLVRPRISGTSEYLDVVVPPHGAAATSVVLTL